MIKVFYLEETGRRKLHLRRYTDGKCPDMSGDFSFHNVCVGIEDTDAVDDAVCDDSHPHDDPRWPKHCTCGYEFLERDTWQLFPKMLYKRCDTGEVITLDNVPVGACWNDGYRAKGHIKPDFYIGEDNRCLVVKTPGGDWYLDGRASNCDMKHDKTHKCWVRHGLPEDGTLTVDKKGHTCGAGAGSIIAGNYHGFLTCGFLISC